MKKLIGVILMCLSLEAYSQSVALVLSAANKVVAKQNNKERTLNRGSQLFTGDTIVTGPGATAQIKYSNGSLVSIQENSNYQIVSYSNKTFETKLNSGAIEYKSNQKKKGVIKTPVVALAILGTHLQAIATPSNTYLDVKQGLVKGGDQLIGPGQTFSSGSFDKNQQFKPGPIPWNYTDSSDSASNGNTVGGDSNESNRENNKTTALTSMDAQIALETIEINTSLIQNTAINSITNAIISEESTIMSLPPSVVELAEIAVICP